MCTFFSSINQTNAGLDNLNPSNYHLKIYDDCFNDVANGTFNGANLHSTAFWFVIFYNEDRIRIEFRAHFFNEASVITIEEVLIQ